MSILQIQTPKNAKTFEVRAFFSFILSISLLQLVHFTALALRLVLRFD